MKQGGVAKGCSAAPAAQETEHSSRAACPPVSACKPPCELEAQTPASRLAVFQATHKSCWPASCWPTEREHQAPAATGQGSLGNVVVVAVGQRHGRSFLQLLLVLLLLLQVDLDLRGRQGHLQVREKGRG